MSVFRPVLVLLFVLHCLYHQCNTIVAHYIDTRASIFHLSASQSKSVSVRTLVLGTDDWATCTLTLRTSPEPRRVGAHDDKTKQDHLLLRDAKLKESAAAKSLQEAERVGDRAQTTLNALHGTCVVTVEGYWTYEVCLGEKIRQYHGTEEYSLGVFSGYAPAQDKAQLESSNEPLVRQQYTGGTVCDAMPNQPVRAVDVVFGCDHEATQLRIATIRESMEKPCHYSIEVKSNKFCNPEDGFLAPSQPLQTPGQQSNMIERWMLRVSAVQDGGILCMAHTLETVSQGLVVHEFDMEIEHKLIGAARSISAKAPGRIPLPSDQYHVDQSECRVTHNSKLFRGRLSNVRMICPVIQP